MSVRVVVMEGEDGACTFRSPFRLARMVIRSLVSPGVKGWTGVSSAMVMVAAGALLAEMLDVRTETHLVVLMLILMLM